MDLAVLQELLRESVVLRRTPPGGATGPGTRGPVGGSRRRFAELDKSTIGKLLTSRASRDPSLHVVVRSTPPPACSDALYDPEIDG